MAENTQAADPQASATNEADAETGRFESAEARESPGRVGETNRRRIHLLLPAGRRRHRELRPLSQTACQDNALRGALTRRGLFNVNARWHRSPRDDSQLARTEDLRSGVEQILRRGGRARGD